MLDTTRPYARCFVCVPHLGALCAVLRGHVLDHDPGEPEYVEPVESTFGSDGAAHWRFRAERATPPEGPEVPATSLTDQTTLALAA